MNTLNDILNRLLQRETLFSIIGIVIFLSGRVETMEQAVALAGVVGPIVLGRSIAKHGAS